MTVSGLSSTLFRVKGILLGSAYCFLFPSLLVYSTKLLFPVSENLASPIRTQLINSLLFRFYSIQLPTPKQHEALLCRACHLPQCICNDFDLSPDNAVRVQENMGRNRQLQHGSREQYF